MNNRLRFLRKDILKLTQKNFANSINLSSNSITEIEKGRSQLTERNFNAICTTFNVNENWLRNGIEPIFNEDKENNLLEEIAEKYPLTEFSKDIIERYLNLSIDKQKAFEKFILNLPEEKFIIDNTNAVKDEMLITEEESTKIETQEEISCTISPIECPVYAPVDTSNIVNIRIFEMSASAGTGNYIGEDVPYHMEEINLNTSPQARRADFALYVRGNSMQPNFYDGDLVFIKEQPSIDNGQIGIFVYDDDAYIKKYEVRKDGEYLISLNPKYKPIKLSDNFNYKVCGLVL